MLLWAEGVPFYGLVRLETGDSGFVVGVVLFEEEVVLARTAICVRGSNSFGSPYRDVTVGSCRGEPRRALGEGGLFWVWDATGGVPVSISLRVPGPVGCPLAGDCSGLPLAGPACVEIVYLTEMSRLITRRGGDERGGERHGWRCHRHLGY